MQTINVYGDHATCCSKSGDLIVRHNAMRNLVNEIAEDGLLSPVLEKKGILGNAPGRRPGDVTIPLWETSGRALALDIAVMSSVNASNLESKSPCESYAHNRKHAKYDKDFKECDSHIFGTLVWETCGAINSEGEAYLRQLMRFASVRQGREHSSYCGRMWSRISCILQREVAREIELRTKDQKYQYKPEEDEEAEEEEDADEEEVAEH